VKPFGSTQRLNKSRTLELIADERLDMRTDVWVDLHALLILRATRRKQPGPCALVLSSVPGRTNYYFRVGVLFSRDDFDVGRWFAEGAPKSTLTIV
jgi:hypothetical protein